MKVALLFAVVLTSLLCGPSAQNGRHHLKRTSKNGVEDSGGGAYEDDLVALLQDMKHSKIRNHWSHPDGQHHTYHGDHERLHMQEDGVGHHHDVHPQQRRQRDIDKIVKFQWGRIRVPRIRRIRVPRIRRIRVPRIRRIRIPRIRRIRVPRIRRIRIPRIRRIRVPRIRRIRIPRIRRIRVPRIRRIRIPRIRVPRIRVPRIRIPRIIPRLPKLPRVSLPRIRVPRIRLNPNAFINKLRGIQRQIVGKLNPLKHLKLRGLGNIANSIVRRALSAVGRVGDKLRNGIMRGVGGQFRGIAARLGRGVSGATSGIFHNLAGIGGRIAKRFKQSILRYAKVLNDNVFKQVHKLIQGIFRRVKDIGRKVVQKARQMNGGVMSGIKGISNKIWQGLRNVQNHVSTRMKAAVGKVMSAMKTFGTTIWKKLKGFVGNMWKGVKRAGMKVLRTFKKTYGTAKGAGIKVFNAAKNFGKMIWNKLKGFVKKLWSGMKKAGGGVLKMILGSGKSLIKFAKSPLGQQILTSGLQGALNALGVPPAVSGPMLEGAMSMMNGQPMGNGGPAEGSGQGEEGGNMQPQYEGDSVQMTSRNYNSMVGQKSQLHQTGQPMHQYNQGDVQQGGQVVQQKQLEHGYARGVALPYEAGHQQEIDVYGGTNAGG